MHMRKLKGVHPLCEEWLNGLLMCKQRALDILAEKGFSSLSMLFGSGSTFSAPAGVSDFPFINCTPKSSVNFECYRLGFQENNLKRNDYHCTKLAWRTRIWIDYITNNSWGPREKRIMEVIIYDHQRLNLRFIGKIHSKRMRMKDF